MSATPDRRPDGRRPPTTFTDAEGRTIAISESVGSSGALVEMYGHFDDGSRAQGLPPRTDARMQEWVAGLLDEGLNVVARHGDDVVGHAVLLPHGDAAELAIFVRPEYQSAGIGTRLVRRLLAYGRGAGLEHVWLVVAATNTVARRLYRSAGFETTARQRGEHRMERTL